VQDAFDLADLYRTPVMVLSDGQLGQMMEPVVFRDRAPRELPSKDGWTLTGADGREQHIVHSFFLAKGALTEHNFRLQAKYREIEEKEVRCEERDTEGADLILVAYGTSARVCLEVMRSAEDSDTRLGLIRPITLWPFPTAAIRRRAEKGTPFLVVEMSAGQMVEDVRLAVEGRVPVGFCGRPGGGVPSTDEVAEKVHETLAAAAARPPGRGR